MGANVQPSGSSSTTSSLLLRVRERDPDAWKRLADLFGPLIYGWSRRYGLSADDAADVVQETLLAVARGIDQFRPIPNAGFRSWLWTISRNKMHDLGRRRQGQSPAVGGTNPMLILSQLPEAVESENSIYLSGWSHTVRRALDLIRNEFEDRTWQAFWSVVIDEQSTADVASTMGMSTAAVRQAKSRVLRRLKLELGELPEE